VASCLDYLGIFPVDQQPIAGGVCLAESSDRLDAECLNCAGVPEDSVCWWQINLNAHPQYDRERLRTDPAYCAQAAYDVSNGGTNWHPWSTYTNGAYLRFIDQAAAGAPADGGASAAAAPAPAAASQEPADRSGLVLLGFAAVALYVAGVI
jgi:Lysozyme like domain